VYCCIKCKWPLCQDLNSDILLRTLTLCHSEHSRMQSVAQNIYEHCWEPLQQFFKYLMEWHSLKMLSCVLKVNNSPNCNETFSWEIGCHTCMHRSLHMQFTIHNIFCVLISFRWDACTHSGDSWKKCAVRQWCCWWIHLSQQMTYCHWPWTNTVRVTGTYPGPHSTNSFIQMASLFAIYQGQQNHSLYQVIRHLSGSHIKSWFCTSVMKMTSLQVIMQLAQQYTQTAFTVCSSLAICIHLLHW